MHAEKLNSSRTDPPHLSIAVIGAGPTGLSLAYELSRHGHSVDVYEKDAVPGGLAKSITLWGQEVEVGPHYLSENMEAGTRDLLNTVIRDDQLHRYERKTRIYINGKFYNYPPGAVNLIKNLGPWKTLRTGCSYLAQIIRPVKSEGSVESFITRNLGSYLYKNFFKGYSEKLWGVPCSTLDESYGKTMIGFGELGRLQTLKKYFVPKNVLEASGNLYPKGGMNVLWRNLTDQIRKQGGTVHFSADLRLVAMEDHKVKGLQFADGTVKPYHIVISTIPEAVLLGMLSDVPAKISGQLASIKTRCVISVFLLIDHQDFMEFNSVFIYTDKIKATRITNYNAFRNEEGNDILSVEYWTSDQDELWLADSEQIIATVQNDLRHFQGHEKVRIRETKIIKLRNAYQIPFPELKVIKAEVADYLNGFDGLHIAGRANQTKFNYGMGDALAEGVSKARELMQRKERACSHSIQQSSC